MGRLDHAMEGHAHSARVHSQFEAHLLEPPDHSWVAKVARHYQRDHSTQTCACPASGQGQSLGETWAHAHSSLVAVGLGQGQGQRQSQAHVERPHAQLAQTDPLSHLAAREGSCRLLHDPEPEGGHASVSVCLGGLPQDPGADLAVVRVSHAVPPPANLKVGLANRAVGLESREGAPEHQKVALESLRAFLSYLEAMPLRQTALLSRLGAIPSNREAFPFHQEATLSGREASPGSQGKGHGSQDAGDPSREEVP